MGGHVALNVMKNFSLITHREDTLGIRMARWDDNIKLDHKDIGYESVERNRLVQGSFLTS